MTKFKFKKTLLSIGLLATSSFAFISCGTNAAISEKPKVTPPNTTNQLSTEKAVPKTITVKTKLDNDSFAEQTLSYEEITTVNNFKLIKQKERYFMYVYNNSIDENFTDIKWINDILSSKNNVYEFKPLNFNDVKYFVPIQVYEIFTRMRVDNKFIDITKYGKFYNRISAKNEEERTEKEKDFIKKSIEFEKKYPFSSLTLSSSLAGEKYGVEFWKFLDDMTNLIKKYDYLEFKKEFPNITEELFKRFFDKNALEFELTWISQLFKNY